MQANIEQPVEKVELSISEQRKRQHYLDIIQTNKLSLLLIILIDTLSIYALLRLFSDTEDFFVLICLLLYVPFNTAIAIFVVLLKRPTAMSGEIWFYRDYFVLNKNGKRVSPIQMASKYDFFKTYPEKVELYIPKSRRASLTLFSNSSSKLASELERIGIKQLH